MNNLIEINLGSGKTILLDPSFIREVTGGMASTTVTIERKDDSGNYVTYRIPMPFNEFCRMIQRNDRE